MKPWEIYDPFWYHMNVKPLTLKEFYGPGLVKGLEEPKKMSFLEWSRMINKYEEKPMKSTDEAVQIADKVYDLVMEYKAVVDCYEVNQKELQKKIDLLEQYKKGWDGSNSALAKAYEEIDTLKKKVRDLGVELDHTKQPKGLPTTFTVDEALTLIQQLTRGVQALEGKSLWLYVPYHFYVQSEGGAKMTKVTVTK